MENNCKNCKVSNECECWEKISRLKNYLPLELYEQIEDIIIMQFDCEYYE